MSTLKKGLDYEGKVIKSIYPNKGIVECEGEKIAVKNVLEGQKVSFRHRSLFVRISNSAEAVHISAYHMKIC